MGAKLDVVYRQNPLQLNVASKLLPMECGWKQCVQIPPPLLECKSVVPN